MLHTLILECSHNVLIQKKLLWSVLDSQRLTNHLGTKWKLLYSVFDSWETQNENSSVSILILESSRIILIQKIQTLLRSWFLNVTDYFDTDESFLLRSWFLKAHKPFWYKMKTCMLRSCFLNAQKPFRYYKMKASSLRSWFLKALKLFWNKMKNLSAPFLIRRLSNYVQIEVFSVRSRSLKRLESFWLIKADRSSVPR